MHLHVLCVDGVFVEGDPYLDGDAVFAVKNSLVGKYKKMSDADAKKVGMPASTNQKVIDLLRLNDVPVVDLMGSGPGHNFGGDNLHAAIYGATRTGAVVDGTVRDIEGLFELPTQVFYRDGHPAAVGGVTTMPSSACAIAGASRSAQGILQCCS